MQQVFTDCFVLLYNLQACSLAPKVTYKDKEQAIVDIRLILATSFYFNSQNLGITIFSIMLDKIDNLVNIFSQKDLDKLLLY